jgi:hypothetical protein
MTLPRNEVYLRILGLVVTLTAVATPLLAQFNPFDPANLSQIFGGPTINQNGITFQQPHLEQLPQFLQALPQNFAQSFLNPVGSALAMSIRQTRQNVRNQGCGPAPPQVVSQLAPFMPPSVFNGVCWAVVRPGFGIDTLVIQDGGMAAVTLDDTIVFRDQQSGFDPRLWAHELIHVGQYRRLSVEGFANIYSYDFRRLEGEAIEFENFVAARIDLQPGGYGWRQTYYNPSDNWNPYTGMSGQVWAQQAKVTLDPHSCIRVEGESSAAGNSVQVFNDCPIPVVVADFTMTTAQGQFRLPCGSNCQVAAGGGMAYPMQPGVVHADVHIVW